MTIYMVTESTVVPGASLEEEKVLMKMRNTGLQYQVYRLEQVRHSGLCNNFQISN